MGMTWEGKNGSFFSQYFFSQEDGISLNDENFVSDTLTKIRDLLRALWAFFSENPSPPIIDRCYVPRNRRYKSRRLQWLQLGRLEGEKGRRGEAVDGLPSHRVPSVGPSEASRPVLPRRLLDGMGWLCGIVRLVNWLFVHSTASMLPSCDRQGFLLMANNGTNVCKVCQLR